MRSLVVCIFVFYSYHANAGDMLEKFSSFYKELKAINSKPNSLGNYPLDKVSYAEKFSLNTPVFMPLKHSQFSFKPEYFQSQEQSSISLHYVHFQQKIPVSFFNNMKLVSGAGFTYFDSVDGLYGDRAALSISLGVETRFNLTQSTFVKLESRLFGTYFNEDKNLYCISNGCQLNVTDDFWLQKQVSLNFIYQF